MDGNCHPHLLRFTSLCDEYVIDKKHAYVISDIPYNIILRPTITSRHFVNLHSQDGKVFVQTLRKDTSEKQKEKRFSRQLKVLTFRHFLTDESSDDAAFKNLLAEMERLSCLAYDKDQTDVTLCDILWKAVKGEPWVLHNQTKEGIEFVFARAVEGLSDSIHKYTAEKAKNKSHHPILCGDHHPLNDHNSYRHDDNIASNDPILYGDHANNNPYDNGFDKVNCSEHQRETSAESDTFFTHQRRFTLHLSTLSLARQR